MTPEEFGKNIDLVEFIDSTGRVVWEATRWTLEGFGPTSKTLYTACCRAVMDEAIGDFTYSNMKVRLVSGEVFYAIHPSLASIHTKWKTSGNAMGNRITMTALVLLSVDAGVSNVNLEMS